MSNPPSNPWSHPSGHYNQPASVYSQSGASTLQELLRSDDGGMPNPPMATNAQPAYMANHGQPPTVPLTVRPPGTMPPRFPPNQMPPQGPRAIAVSGGPNQPRFMQQQYNHNPMMVRPPQFAGPQGVPMRPPVSMASPNTQMTPSSVGQSHPQYVVRVCLI